MTLVAGFLVLIAWFGIGRVLVRRIVVESLIGEALLALALGAAVHSTLQALGLLAGVPAMLPLLLLAVVGGTALVRDRAAVLIPFRTTRDALRTLGRFERIGLVLFVGLLALQLLKAFAPPTSYDALCYHLPEIEKYARTASLEPIPHLGQTYYPKGIEVLFVGAYTIGGATAAQLVHGILGAAFVLSVFEIARRLLGRPAAIAAGLLALALRDVTYEFGTANVDLAFAFLQLAALATLPAIFVAENRPTAVRAAALAGTLAGFGVAAKLLGAGLVVVLAVTVAAVEIFRRRVKAALIGALVLGSFALLVYLPWFVRARLELGTIAYPLLPAKVEVVGRPERPGASAASELERAGQIYPLRDTPLPLAFWTLTFAQSKFKTPLTPLVPALLPVGLFLLLVHRRGQGGLGLMTIAALATGAFWFKTYPVVRYVLGPLGLLVVVIVLAIRWLAQEGYVARVVVVGLVGLVAGLALAKGAREAVFAGRAVVSSGFREIYVDRSVNSHPTMRRVRAEAGPDGRILSSDPRVFLVGAKAEHAGPWNLAWPRPRTAAELRAWLRVRGIEWVAYFSTKAGELDPALLTELRDAGVLEARFEDEPGALYRVISAKSSE